MGFGGLIFAKFPGLGDKPGLGGKPPPRHPRSVQMVAYGSDGASVFMGKHNGAVVKSRRKLCFLVTVQCLAHRIALEEGGDLTLAQELDLAELGWGF